MIEWRPILETDNYEVNINGDIRNTNTGHICKQYIDERGRLKVYLRIDGRLCGRYVKRLVFEAFNGPVPNGLCVMNIDNDSTNCHLDNLEIGTQSEIILNQYSKHGRIPSNQRKIRCVETGKVYESISECSRDTGIHKSTICRNVNSATAMTRCGLRFEPV